MSSRLFMNDELFEIYLFEYPAMTHYSIHTQNGFAICGTSRLFQSSGSEVYSG